MQDFARHVAVLRLCELVIDAAAHLCGGSVGGGLDRALDRVAVGLLAFIGLGEHADDALAHRLGDARLGRGLDVEIALAVGRE